MEVPHPRQALKVPHVRTVLSPGWVHAISIIMSYSLKSEIAKSSRNGSYTMILMIPLILALLGPH